MRFGEGWKLMAMCVAAAAAGAAGVSSLDHHGYIQIALVADEQPDQSAAEPITKQAAKRTDRLPLAQPELQPEPEPVEAPFETVTLRELPLETPPLPEEPPAADEMSAATAESAEFTESENPDWWPTEVQRNAAPKPTSGPRVASSPVKRLATPTPPAAVRGPVSDRLSERLAEISPAATTRLTEKFVAAEAAWPPSEVALVALKDEKIVELVARSSGGSWKLIHRYPVLAASGSTGPKLRKGDKQVPEGVYGISFLNPDSRYHVSLRVNYPNSFDRQMADKDGRKELGGDIMIHGKNVSAGCLAVGDTAAEELFVLAAKTGIDNVKVVIAPTDLRRNSLPDTTPGQPVWLPKLYTTVASAMSEYPKAPSTGLLSFFGK
ncbi:MAG: L,D-transpeptidase family protein [Hyphomicrobium sp.]